MAETDRYAQQIVIEPPFPTYVANRKAAGLSGTVCIDPCIIDEIKALWEKGILTHGCCCGHNNPPMYPFVNVSDEYIPLMIELGYIQEHPDPTRKDTFRLKSV